MNDNKENTIDTAREAFCDKYIAGAEADWLDWLEHEYYGVRRSED